MPADPPLPGPADDDTALQRLSSLAERSRRELYAYVAGRGEPVTRDDAAAACGLERSTAAYHLDRLVDEGLLAASFARPAGRGGPGAGRPAKRYERGDAEVSVSLPPRDYRLAAEILARAVDGDGSGTVRRAVESAAAAVGAELVTDAAGAAGRDLRAFLAAQGFEPYLDGDVLRLRNCPFHAVAERHTAVVCGMNRAMLDTVATAIGPGTDAVLDPAPGRCCVAFRREGGWGAASAGR